MNPVQLDIQKLPSPVRMTLYWIVALLGAALAILELVDISDLGPITVDQLQEIYLYLSTATGVVAVSNVNRPMDTPTSATGDYLEGLDMSSFEPIGEIDDVYGEPLP